MNTTSLLNRLSQTERKSLSSAKDSKSKSSRQRQMAETKYKRFFSLSRSQKHKQMKNSVKCRNPQWKHDYYKVNKQFHISSKQGMDVFPHNNKKYNIQFLDKTLQGGGLDFTSQDNGYFVKPSDELYSKHYVPIVTEKRKYNEDFELRTSLFGKTWVDQKRDRIMNDYELQTNPFSTARSNQLICLMRPARKHRFS